MLQLCTVKILNLYKAFQIVGISKGTLVEYSLEHL